MTVSRGGGNSGQGDWRLVEANIRGESEKDCT